jgi:aryl-alcohol dehydrogenase-like predicted oxidoreductase
MRDAIRNLAPAHRDRLVVVLQSYDRTGFLLRPFFERGLRALGLERADGLILGWYRDAPPARILDAALALREAGLVRFLVLSGHRRSLFAEIAETSEPPIDVMMIRYTAAHRGAEREIFPYLPDAARHGVTCYTATRWGQLLDPSKMPPGEAPLTAADCYRFVLTNPHVDLCMTGPKSEEQMEDALRALDLGPLSDEEMARARRIGDFVHGQR